MSTNNYTTAPQSSVGGQPAKIVLQTSDGNPAGNVGATKVAGIQETRGYTSAITTTPNSIPAGKLGFTILFSSDFVGTVGGIAYSGATQAAYSDAAQPGNTLPSVAITCSAGSYSVITAGAT